ncbi:hypothetical protein EXIGLDRAFT_135358 [Exidia glandulosa HHB12029]|uniref:Uncharacterized protein n=1 Tax=Exidia glandulosa HHB12029 TaxID=1314781 RepID=A0A165NGB0_EXIGL|nr:hypothetical protein EXIGLDRAFT_135358 [Exidia glandulosa HHB12029]
MDFVVVLRTRDEMPVHLTMDKHVTVLREDLQTAYLDSDWNTVFVGETIVSGARHEGRDRLCAGRESARHGVGRIAQGERQENCRARRDACDDLYSRVRVRSKTGLRRSKERRCACKTGRDDCKHVSGSCQRVVAGGDVFVRTAERGRSSGS